MRSSYSVRVILPKISVWTLPRMFMPAPWMIRTFGMLVSFSNASRTRYRAAQPPARSRAAGPAARDDPSADFPPNPAGAPARGFPMAAQRRIVATTAGPTGDNQEGIMQNRIRRTVAIAGVAAALALPAWAQAPVGIPGVVAPGSQPELVQEGFTFTEGPLGTADGGLYF